MSGDRTAYAWAVLSPPSWGSVSPDIYSIGGTRAAAMERFVNGWRYATDEALAVSKIWQRAYRQGWRLARVSITPTHGY